ncbi:hypothetical protein PPUJ20005_41970 [Pseudomonas putida]|uniref:alpha/beta hydrolase n=1 Tax=Pseudomonas putida TaxID=303 RepID=UPI00235BC5C9|nr:alpha/beta hydrolase [Pseudomonas putida]GLO10228.1 hypothetical protein PPUJ20005_41970 [Pseudomonas putida]HDS0985852.1 alpha/beta hydrolase [Pseudomonas putida]
MQFEPTQLTINEFLQSSVETNKQFRIHDENPAIERFECFAHFVSNSKKLVCLMPSALPAGREKPEAVFHRWSWSSHIHENVISLNDPTFSINDIYCGWFLGDGTKDLISRHAKQVQQIARKLNVSNCDIIFYGSSMGGFAALMMASVVEGSLAIAEVPQLDLRDYPVKGAIRDIEKYCLKGDKLESFASEHPHLISVFDRFKKEKNTPNFTIITNNADIEFLAALDLFKALNHHDKAFNKKGRAELKIHAENIGHRPLPTVIGVEFIKAALQAKPVTQIVIQEIGSGEDTASLDYKTVLNEAIELSKQIKFVRTDADKEVYTQTIAKLYQASELNKTADWPLLKVCSIEKQWTNSFNTRILEAAQEALSRRETLEGFIYCCRGYLYNYDSVEATNKISSLIDSCSDSQIANVGNIFKAITSYEHKDYEAYNNSIKTFNSNKSPEYSPYIAIPAATVYTENTFAPVNYDPKMVHIQGKSVVPARFESQNKNYIVSISCDEKYFNLYGKYIIKSFTKHCSNDAILHITFLGGDTKTYLSRIEQWGGKSIEISVADITTEINKGPIASLLRFINIHQLVTQTNIPVLVLDLDTVIKKSFIDLVQMMRSENIDVLSRVLQNGMAPWEKYTGGFAFFNNTPNALAVAKNIAYISEQLCRTDITQWWIDQNIFEAGIRERLLNSKDFSLKNIYNIRDQYCVMPVGNTESKTFTLDNALVNFG